jgi:ribosomal protein S18 acetylase RimI-like enzyme
MRSLEFRQATVQDAPEIAALVNSGYRGESSKQGWTTEADLLDGLRTDETEIRSLIQADDSMTLLCIDETAIIGSVHIQKEGSACYLSMLIVKPGLQGSGIGRQLIEVAETRARETWSSERMTMSVITIRAELIAYYERRGYRRTGEMKPFVFDEVHGIPRVDGIELEVLEKELT